MKPPDSVCPKCGGTMELGYTADYSHGAVYLGHWIRGLPTAGLLSFFDSLRIANPEGQFIPIGTYRCQKCGFLEFYARDAFQP